MKILMVCLGNICRSPLAEGILRHKASAAGLNWEVDSAGTESFHVGEQPHRLSRKVAALHGMDISGYRARQLKADDFHRYDKLYALAPDVYRDMEHIAPDREAMKKVDLLMNEVVPGKDLPVPDPWYGPEAGYHEAYELIDKACDHIIARYAGKSEKTL